MKCRLRRVIQVQMKWTKINMNFKIVYHNYYYFVILIIHSHLFVLLELSVVHLAYLLEFVAVVGVFDGVLCGVVSGRHRRLRCHTQWVTPSLLRACHSLSNQHVVKPHELRVWAVVIFRTSETQAWWFCIYLYINYLYICYLYQSFSKVEILRARASIKCKLGEKTIWNLN